MSLSKFCVIKGKVLSLIQNILGGQISESTNKCKKMTPHNIYRMEKSFFWGSTGIISRAFVVAYLYQ